jgi:hypothetical protein
MTSVFDVIAHEDSQQLLEARKAAVLSSMRVSETLGSFLGAARTQDEWSQRMALVEDDFVGIVTAACQEAGYSDTDRMLRTARAGLNRQAAERFQPVFGREASIHEARKPKLCPYHREVVDIALNSGNPAAGYEAMSAHWGGGRHCEGDGYKGDNCNFRPQMTTQEYWDSKAEKAKERREERERQQAEQEALQETVPPEAVEPTEEPVSESTEVSDNSDTPDNVVELPTAQEPAAPAGEGVPMSMAASFRVEAAPVGVPGSFFPEEEARTVGRPRQYGVEAPCPQCGATMFDGVCSNRQCPNSWMGDAEYPQTNWGPGHQAMVKEAPGKEHMKGVSPKRNRQYEHIYEQCIRDGGSEEHCKEMAARTVNKQRSEHGETKSHTAAEPSPKMDKRKWTPNRKLVDTEDENSRWPTHDGDVTDKSRAKNDDIRNPRQKTQIGENTTERQDVTQKGGPSRGPHTQTWTEGPGSAVTSAADDVHKNPIRELMVNGYGGFVPHAEVQAAIDASK